MAPLSFKFDRFQALDFFVASRAVAGEKFSLHPDTFTLWDASSMCCAIHNDETVTTKCRLVWATAAHPPLQPELYGGANSDLRLTGQGGRSTPAQKNAARAASK